MSVRSKNAERLAVLEAEFLGRLTADLEGVASGANTLFFYTVEFNPYDLPAHQLPAESAILSELALGIVALRRVLKLSTSHTPAELFRTYLQRHANLSDAHGLGPRRLAAELLERLRSDS